MKKFILLVFAVLLSFALTAQDRTLATRTFTSVGSMLTYTGVAADTLTANQDSIDFVFIPNKAYPCQVYILTELDTIDGADTTVTAYLYGRMFSTQNWALVTSTASTNVAAATENVLYNTAQNSGTMSWDTVGNVNTFTGTYTSSAITNFYREYRVVYVIKGDDHVGKGVAIKSYAIKLWERN